MSRKTKKMWQITVLTAVNLILLILVSGVCAKAERLGSSGERVAEIQRELMKHGIYTGKESGIYDFGTRKAIGIFQGINGLEKSGETDLATVSALGLDSGSSVCFSARTELLARCVQLSPCRSYPEMLSKAEEILRVTDGVMTLGKYISENHPDFLSRTDEPSDEAYAATIQALRKNLLF